MRKSVLALLVLTALLLSLRGITALSSQGNYWVKTYGGKGNDVITGVAVAEDGSIIVVGYTNSSGNEDAFVMKLSPKGKVLWARTYGGDLDDYASSVALTGDGDIIVVGHTYSFGAGLDDAWVFKLDSNGNILWQKTYGGSNIDEAYAVALTPRGDIVIAGNTMSFGAGSEDVWVLKLNDNGSVIWARTYGGGKCDRASSVTISSYGDIIVAGYTKSFGVGNSDVWVLCLDKQGNIKWQKTYGGSNGDYANGVGIMPNGDIVVVGDTNSSGVGYYDAWILMLDKEGNIEWQKTYGGPYTDVATAVTVASNGDILVGGFTGSFGNGSVDVWVLKLDGSGNVVWQKTYGGKFDDVASAVALTPENDIAVVGSTLSFGASIGNWPDGWVLHIPPNGTLKDCDFCMSSNAVVRKSSAQVLNSSATPEVSDVLVLNSDAHASVWSPTVKTQYPLPVGGRALVSKLTPLISRETFLFLAVIGLTVVLGWWVVHTINGKRKRRQEELKRIEEALKKIEKLNTVEKIEKLEKLLEFTATTLPFATPLV